MGAFVGVDLGTTFTAAAVWRGDHAEIVELGNRSASIPSVVLLADDGSVLTGEAATRRAMTEPTRVAREFKRRIGDTIPVLVGGRPYSAEALTARLLRSVIDEVTRREGSTPEVIAVTHPANWGAFKLDLLHQAVRLADLPGVRTISEPEAAATYYASLARVEEGSVVAVYDLGGGTFDAAVLRKTAGGFAILGAPEGIERLGGIDFDGAVFAHVRSHVAGALDRLDPDDPMAAAAVARLRDECVAAKEALSLDTRVSIPVLLPGVQTEVGLTRAEFEDMIRPALGDTIRALHRAVASGGVATSDLTAVLLVGGSSRIPLVAELVSAELGRPATVDAHPKHVVALGAATAAAAGQPARPAPPVMPATPTSGLPRPPGTAARQPPPPPMPAQTPPPGIVEPAAVPAESAITAPPPGPPPFVPPGSTPPPPAAPPPGAPPAAPTGPPMGPPTGPAPRRRAGGTIGVLVVAVLLVAGAVAFLIMRGGSDSGQGATDTSPDTAIDTVPATDSTIANPGTTPVTEAPTTTLLGDFHCKATGQAVQAADLCIRIDAIGVDPASKELRIDWTPIGFNADVTQFHAHFFWNIFKPDQAGNNAAALGAKQGRWALTDQRPFIGQGEIALANKPPDATEMCVTVGDLQHNVVDPANFQCVPLPNLNG